MLFFSFAGDDEDIIVVVVDVAVNGICNAGFCQIARAIYIDIHFGCVHHFKYHIITWFFVRIS